MDVSRQMQTTITSILNHEGECKNKAPSPLSPFYYQQPLYVYMVIATFAYAGTASHTRTTHTHTHIHTYTHTHFVPSWLFCFFIRVYGDLRIFPYLSLFVFYWKAFSVSLFLWQADCGKHTRLWVISKVEFQSGDFFFEAHAVRWLHYVERRLQA